MFPSLLVVFKLDHKFRLYYIKITASTREMVQLLGSMVVIGLYQNREVLKSWAVSCEELKLEGLAVLANDIFLTFFWKTIEHEHMTLY